MGFSRLSSYYSPGNSVLALCIIVAKPFQIATVAGKRWAMVQDWQDWLARRETSAVSEHAHNTGHKPLWNEVKFIDRDPYYYTRRVKEAIHIRLHPNNINKDSGIEIPEAWMPTIKKHNNRRAMRQRTAEGANHWVNSKYRNAPIRAAKTQPITTEHHAL